MWTIKWWKTVAELAIRSFASSLAAWLTVAGTVVGVEDVNWLRGLSLAGIATLVSVLFSISTHGVTGNGPTFTSVYKDTPTDSDGVEQNIINGKHYKG